MMNGSSGMYLNWIFGLLILAVIIGMIIRGMCEMPRRRQHENSSDEAMEMLRQRYARGEIDDKEFEYMKQELDH